MRARRVMRFLAACGVALGLLLGHATVAAAYANTYYVAASGSDAHDGLSAGSPFATLAKTADVINGLGEHGDYLVVVMSDLTSTAVARYYNNSVTIASQGAARFTVTRGTPFAVTADASRGWYNPGLLEIQTTDFAPAAPAIVLTLQSIVFDDAGRREAANFSYAPSPGAGTGMNYVQDGIVTSYAPNATIVLDAGAELRNFGGMTAIRAAGAGVLMRAGSLVTDTTVTARGPRPTTTYGALGDAAVSVTSAQLRMEAGSAITHIVDSHGALVTGASSVFMDGEISGLRGAMNFGDDGNGRGNKNALSLSGGGGPITAEIGPNGQVIDNQVKSGSVQARGNTTLTVRGKISGNTGLAGGTLTMQGTNGAALYIISFYGEPTVYLEDGSEIRNNKINGISGYGAAASVQQGNARLIMNGGLIAGNTAPQAPAIAVNKGNASFVMNGGVIDNGANAIQLQNNSGDGTNGTLTLNAGTTSGVTVDATTTGLTPAAVTYGNATQRHLYISPAMVITSGWASVAGRRVTPIQADFRIGNPNAAGYAVIRANLPPGWTTPVTDANVIGFWMQKNGQAVFSVPKPTTGTLPGSYNSSFNTYIAAVVAVDAAGAPLAGAPVRYYPTAIDGGNIVIQLPLAAYAANGVTVALAQPTTDYNQITVTAPPTLLYAPGGASYSLAYTAAYDMPAGWREALVTDGYASATTPIVLAINPDARVTCPNPGLTLASAVFQLNGSPSWDAASGQLRAPLSLKSGWDATADLASNFTFSCQMAAANFQDEDFLYLSAELTLADARPSGSGASYNIYSNLASTQMIAPLHTVRFDGNGGDVRLTDEERQARLGATLGPAMPDNPQRDQHTFLGWNTQPNGQGAAFTGATEITGDITVYAQWRLTSPPAGGDNIARIPSLIPATLALLAAALWTAAALRACARRGRVR